MSFFLASLSPAARANITCLRLAHDMQGPSLHRENAVYREKERKKLVIDLRFMVAKCTSLQHLGIWVTVRGSRLKLTTDEAWAQDIITGLEGLKDAKGPINLEVGVRLGDDSSHVARVAAEDPPDHRRIQRATQLADAADAVKREVLDR